MDAVPYTPAQQRVVDELLGLGQPRPTFAADLAAELRAAIEADLAEAAPQPPDESLWIGKRALAQIHACEAHYEADYRAEQQGDGFEWSPATAEGELAHRALERTLSVKGEVIPLDLVDRTMTRLVEGDDGLGRYLAGLDPLDAANLRALAAQRVTAFVECWPRLRASWAPRTEASLRAELCGGRIVVSGRPDLALGLARGTEARVLLVDLKTGGRYGHQLDDLRFYALVQTLRIGVPPFRVATYYLDSATFWAEDVTVDTLAIARRRLVDGARAMAAIRARQRPATITAGPACGWCRLRETCEGPRLRAEEAAAHG